MSEQVPTNQVSLDDLKRAIEAKERAWADDNVSDYGAAALRAEAWRTAYEWREGVLRRFHEQFFPDQAEAYIAELKEGRALIAEKLR